MADGIAGMVLTPDEKEEMRERVESYHTQLFQPENKHALDYLMNDRHLEESTIRHFMLGYVGGAFPTDRGYIGRIAIPFVNLTGYRNIRFRALGQTDGPKYLQPHGTPVGLFNVNALADGGEELFILEGEVDCMTMYQCGFPAVGYPGATSVQEWHRYLYEGYKRVYILGDGDEAGRKFAESVAKIVPGPQLIPLPDGYDVSEIYSQQGREGILNLLGIEGE